MKVSMAAGLAAMLMASGAVAQGRGGNFEPPPPLKATWVTLTGCALTHFRLADENREQAEAARAAFVPPPTDARNISVAGAANAMLYGNDPGQAADDRAREHGAKGLRLYNASAKAYAADKGLDGAAAAAARKADKTPTPELPLDRCAAIEN